MARKKKLATSETETSQSVEQVPVVTPKIEDGYNGIIKRMVCSGCQHIFYITQADYEAKGNLAYCHECSIAQQAELTCALCHRTVIEGEKYCPDCAIIIKAREEKKEKNRLERGEARREREKEKQDKASVDPAVRKECLEQIRVIESLLKRYPEDKGFYLQKAEKLIEICEYRKAIETLTEARKVRSENKRLEFKCLLLRGKMYEKLGHFKEAIYDYQMAEIYATNDYQKAIAGMRKIFAEADLEQMTPLMDI